MTVDRVDFAGGTVKAGREKDARKSSEEKTGD